MKGIGAMTLSPSGAAAGLNVNGNIVGTGDVKGGTRVCIGTDCRDRWPDVPGGGGGGAGDNLGNHIATQDLQMIDGNAVKHSVKNAAVVQADNALLQQLNVTGPSTLNGILKIDTPIFGSLAEDGRVLMARDSSGLASWTQIRPRVVTFGSFDSRQSAPPAHYQPPELQGWDFCSVSSIYNDGGSDTGSAMGCELTTVGLRDWSVDVTGSQNDQTKCKITCMKFPTASDR
jgi:hypothetical protein